MSGRISGAHTGSSHSLRIGLCPDLSTDVMSYLMMMSKKSGDVLSGRPIAALIFTIVSVFSCSKALSLGISQAMTKLVEAETEIGLWSTQISVDASCRIFRA